jgi:hypothetical protein
MLRFNKEQTLKIPGVRYVVTKEEPSGDKKMDLYLNDTLSFRVGVEEDDSGEETNFYVIVTPGHSVEIKRFLILNEIGYWEQ